MTVYANELLTFEVSAYSLTPVPMTFSANTLPSGARLFHYGEVDVNDDGSLDISDFAMFAHAYNSYITDPQYNADCDFNKDGYVNGADFSIFELVFDAGTGSILRKSLLSTGVVPVDADFNASRKAYHNVPCRKRRVFRLKNCRYYGYLQ